MDNMEIRKKSLLTAEFFLGIFCIGAICILFYFTVMIRGKDLLFQSEKVYVTVQFPTAGALAVNDKVKVIGVDMGQVSKIELAPDNNSVIVTLQMNKNLRMNEDYEITIQNSSIFGGAYVNIIPGTNTESPVYFDRMLIGKPPVDIIMEASGLIAQLKEDERKLRELFEGGFFDDIKNVISSIESNSRNLDLICQDLREGKGTLGKLFKDQELYEEAKKSLANISTASENISTLLADVREGKGTLGKLVRDDEVYLSMKDSLNSINALAGKISESDGSLAKFLNDNGKLYASLENALQTLDGLSQNLDNLSKDVTGGKGTIGKLLSDDSLYVEFKDTVRQLRAAIEDFREMAPVATFGSIALGAL